MRKFFYCILPFILIWGVYGSLLFVPQLHYEYLGTVESNIVTTVEEYHSDNDYFNIYNYQFTYKDKLGRLRNSKDISINEVALYIPSKGFNTRSENDWIVKQLIEKSKVYAPGWKIYIVIIVCTLVPFLLMYFFTYSIDHLSCISNNNNYECGDGCDCFGCPFCITDKQTICELKTNLKRPENKIKEFFGYGQ